jgi:DNA-binding transcriptional MerR regulator
MESVLTVAEVARVLRAVDGPRAMPARAVRYYARTGMVEPTGRVSGARGSRLYTLTDVALLRLAMRLRREGVHERAVWGLLIYRSDELRSLISSGVGTLTVADPRVLSIGTEQASAHHISIAVASLIEGLDARVRAYRTAHPNIWTGAAWVPASQFSEAHA